MVVTQFLCITGQILFVMWILKCGIPLHDYKCWDWNGYVSKWHIPREMFEFKRFGGNAVSRWPPQDDSARYRTNSFVQTPRIYLLGFVFRSDLKGQANLAIIVQNCTINFAFYIYTWLFKFSLRKWRIFFTLKSYPWN